jgi:ABC-type uncharacterized transport system permease subunit
MAGMTASAWTLTGIESGLIYTALTVFGGATFVGLRVVTGKRKGRPLRPMLTVGTLALVLLLVFLAIRDGAFPLVRRFEILLVAAVVLSACGWILDRRFGHNILAAVAAPTLALLTLFALLLAMREAGSEPDRRLLVVTHVLLALLGFAGLALAAGVATLYLWQIRMLKSNPTAAAARHSLPLETLDRINFLAVAFGFPFLALSALGASLFIERTGTGGASPWLDPTVLGTLGGLAVYLVLFATRTFLGWYGRRIAWLTLLGFFLVIVAFVVAAFCTSENVLHGP